VAHEPNCTHDRLIIFDTNLYAMDYKVVVTGIEVAVSGTAPAYEIYESHTGTTRGIRTTSLNPMNRNVMNTENGGYPVG
jgi:hypothetical protein